MKRVITFLFFLAPVLAAGYRDDHPRAASPAASKDADARAGVLVVGFEREKIASNYYHDGMIAEKIDIPVDSLAAHFNRAIVDRLAGVTSGPARFIRVARDATGNIPARVRREGDEERRRDDLSRVAPGELARLLDTFEAGYLLVMSQYYMKREEEPFPYLYHIINYEVYDRAGVKRHEGNASFDTPDLFQAGRLDKHYRKVASRILDRVQRVVTGDRKQDDGRSARDEMGK